MPTTPNGLPYPAGTDRVMDGDDAIKGLATALRIWAGNVLLNLATTPTATVHINFPAGLFTATPNVVASLATAAWNANATGMTTTGVDIAARSLSGTAGSGTTTAFVIAVQIP